MADHMFQCPYCAEANPVDLGGIGHATVCKACGMPFVPTAKTASPMSRDGEAWVAAPADNDRAEQDEQTLMTVNPAVFREHPFQTLLMAALIVAGLIAIIAFAWREDPDWMTRTVTVLGIIAAAGSAAMLIVRAVMTRFESLTVTTQRSIWARGIITRQSSEVQHDDIRNIQVNQSFTGRLLNAGTIAISSAGQGDMEIIIPGIASPKAVIDTIRTYQRKLVKDD